MRHRLVQALVTAAVVAASLVVGDTAVADEDAPTASETFTVGPFDLAPQGEPGDQINRLFETVPRPAGDIWVRSIDWALVDGDGQPLAGHDAHLHHIVLLDSARPDQLCSFPSQSRFSGTGKELTPFSLPTPYAYRAPDSPWSAVYHVMNLSDAPIQASIEYTVTWTDAADGDFLDVEPYFLDVTGCWGNSEYTVPGDGGPGSVHEESRSYLIDRDGVAVVGGGHLHAGGIDLTLTHEGTEVCRSVAVYGSGGGHHSLQSVTPCGQVDHEWSAGDEIELVARYENHQPVPGAMGIMLMYVHHTGPPPPPPTIAIADVELTDGALIGIVECSRSMTAFLDGQITQPKRPVPISAYGYTESPIPCGPDPGPFVLPLMGANGVLTGGVADFHVYARASSGRDYVFTEEIGQVRVRGRVDLTGPTVEPGGPIAIELDPHLSAIEPRLTGTIDCPEPSMVYLDAGLSQRVGRNLVGAYAFDSLDCDGLTPFEMPVSQPWGRFSGGPVDVVVHAWSFDGGLGTSSAAVGQVRMTGSTPPSDNGWVIPDPDPSSPLQIDSATATAESIVVEVVYDECPVGAEYYLDVFAIDDRRGKGHRLEPPTTYGFDYGLCDEGAEFTVEMGPLATNRLAVQVYLNWYDPASATWDFATNTARVRLK